MKIDEIKAIAEIVAANDLAELKLEREGFSLEIKRGGNTVVAAAPVSVIAPAPAAAAAAAPAAAPAAPAADNAKRITIDSPLVGTLYRAPSPEAAPFVKVGDKVITSKYAGTEVKLNKEEYIIVRQSDILAVVE